MPRPVFDHFGRHDSYQDPLLADRISDLISLKETKKDGNQFVVCVLCVFEISRCHYGGFGRNLGEIIPTSLTELPIQLKDLRNDQKSFKTNFLEAIKLSVIQLSSLKFPFWALYSLI